MQRWTGHNNFQSNAEKVRTLMDSHFIPYTEAPPEIFINAVENDHGVFVLGSLDSTQELWSAPTMAFVEQSKPVPPKVQPTVSLVNTKHDNEDINTYLVSDNSVSTLTVACAVLLLT